MNSPDEREASSTGSDRSKTSVSKPREKHPENAPSPSWTRRWDRWRQLLGRPVDGASLAIFRMAVGFVMALEAFSLLRPSASTSGKVMLETYYTGADVTFHLPYALFEWLPALSPAWMHRLVLIMGGAALFMALGCLYRLAATIVFLAWGYLYALESTRTYWMSYYYLELLVCFLLIWMPAARRWSIDALFRRNRRPSTVPLWTIYLLRAQLVVTYFYAGLAKVNADWLLDAMPMRIFLAHPGVTQPFEAFLSPALITSLKGLLQSPALAYFLSVSGAFFDLSVGFLLLNRKTRPAGFILLLLFHATNHFILFDDIIWFPLLGVATATIFFDPGWPERLANWFKRRILRDGSPALPASDIYRGAPAAAFLVNRWTALCVTAWIAIQTLLPLRHYFIPGDGRFTWEGLAFSWRLKSEYYSSSPCEIRISDPAIISSTNGSTRIDWSQWHGEPVIYRQVVPGQIDWHQLPEIVALFEPETGERILYNPFSNANSIRTEMESRARVREIWQELYGRDPQNVRRTVPLSEIIDGYASAFQSKGGAVPKSRPEILAMLLKVHGRAGNGQMLPFLRRMHPFHLEKESTISAPFLLIEDSALFRRGPDGVDLVDRKAWRDGENTRGRMDRYAQQNGRALVIHIGEISLPTRNRLPQIFVTDSLATPGSLPSISWDYLRDASISKGMHISTQPFLLRRYARRVATLWEREYGRYPAIHASTGVSLNRRPPQPLVNPAADLASVPVSHLAHNPWIKDLELPRIPREMLREGR